MAGKRVEAARMGSLLVETQLQEVRSGVGGGWGGPMWHQVHGFRRVCGSERSRLNQGHPYVFKVDF